MDRTLVDLDALINCTRSSLEGLPYFPRPIRHDENMTDRELAEDVEAHRKVGRLHSLIFAAAAASARLMDVCDAVIERTEKEPDDEYSEPGDDDDDDGNDGSSSGPAGNGQPGGPGSPGALTRGNGGTLSIPIPPAEPPIPPSPPLA